MLSSIDLKTIKLNKINIHVIDDKGFHPFPIFALILSGHCWEALKKGQGITISSFLYFLLFMLKDPPIISFVNSFRRFRRGFSDIYKKCWINQVETRASNSNLRYYGISHCSTDLTLEDVLSTVAFASLDEFQLFSSQEGTFLQLCTLSTSCTSYWEKTVHCATSLEKFNWIFKNSFYSSRWHVIYKPSLK